MNFIADGYVFEKYHQQRIVQIESNHRVAAKLASHRQKEQRVFKKISTFFYRLSQLRKIRIQVSFDFNTNAFAPDGQLA